MKSINLLTKCPLIFWTEASYAVTSVSSCSLTVPLRLWDISGGGTLSPINCVTLHFNHWEGHSYRQRSGWVKTEHLYSALHGIQTTLKRSGMDHICSLTCMEHHACHRLRWRTSNCSSLLIYRPQEDERLSWPGWLTFSGRFTHISGQSSSENRSCDNESSQAKTDVLATVLCHQRECIRTCTCVRNQEINLRL